MSESRHKYLYERLGDHDFQQLVGALLSLRFPDFVPLPLRQADGGRDGVRVTAAGRANTILRQASAYFAQAELDRPQR